MTNERTRGYWDEYLAYGRQFWTTWFLALLLLGSLAMLSIVTWLAPSLIIVGVPWSAVVGGVVGVGVILAASALAFVVAEGGARKRRRERLEADV